MKSLKFTEPAPELILKGLKDTTCRVCDEKGISEGDNLSLCKLDGKEFARAQVIWVKQTNFKGLSKEYAEDCAPSGNLLRKFSGYYRMKIMPETKIKVIKFKVLR